MTGRNWTVFLSVFPRENSFYLRIRCNFLIDNWEMPLARGRDEAGTTLAQSHSNSS